MELISMVITDLDGTLLNSKEKVSPIDYQTLVDLEKFGICRVAATGRSLFSVKKVLADNFPIDYLIFSSGAGIYNWKKKELLFSAHLSNSQVQTAAKFLVECELDFMLHHPVPENHCFKYFATGRKNPDFERRLRVYSEYCEANSNLDDYSGPASQFIAITENKLSLFEKIKEELKDMKVIRATSPLDGSSVWIEIFSRQVSKALASKWICDHLKIDEKQTLGVGNDYNDLDLLKWAKHSYIVENAPEELKKLFTVTAANNEQGFSKAIRNIL